MLCSTWRRQRSGERERKSETKTSIAPSSPVALRVHATSLLLSTARTALSPSAAGHSDHQIPAATQPNRGGMMWRKHSHTREGLRNPSKTMDVESQLALDEAVARALQYVEEKLVATSLSETTPAIAVLQETSSSPANDDTTFTGSSDLATSQDDIDPDNMTYEELLSLGEAVGTESRGLSDDIISLLPSSVYNTIEDEFEECVICCMPYNNRDVLITLPCRHRYHSHCVTRWLKINKACPVCYKDVFGS